MDSVINSNIGLLLTALDAEVNYWLWLGVCVGEASWGTKTCCLFHNN